MLISNCPEGYSQSHVPGEFFSIGTTEVFYQVTEETVPDCSFHVVVKDAEAPDLNYVENHTINIYGTYQPRSDHLLADVNPELSSLITDNCSICSLEYSQQFFYQAGVNTFTVTAKDCAGNESSCEVSIAVYAGLTLHSPVTLPVAGRRTYTTRRKGRYKSGELEESGIPVEDALLSVQVYPNPTAGVVMVELDNFNNPNVLLSVVNVAGQKVLEQKFSTAGQIEVDLSGNKTGIYIINVLVDGQSIARKINLVH